jgi:hypothetical protein
MSIEEEIRLLEWQAAQRVHSRELVKWRTMDRNRTTDAQEEVQRLRVAASATLSNEAYEAWYRATMPPPPGVRRHHTDDTQNYPQAVH